MFEKILCLNDSSVAKQKCKCIPWNIPRSPNETLRFCISKENDCFDDAMNIYSSEECQCLPDCQAVTFSIFESKSRMEDPGKCVS